MSRVGGRFNVRGAGEGLCGLGCHRSDIRGCTVRSNASLVMVTWGPMDRMTDRLRCWGYYVMVKANFGSSSTSVKCSSVGKCVHLSRLS